VSKGCSEKGDFSINVIIERGALVESVKYYLWLSLTLGAGSRAAVRLVRAAGSAKAVWDDPSDELMNEARIKPAVMEKLRTRRDLDEVCDIISWCAENDVAILTPDMSDYPKSLLCLMDFPMVLFCKGELPDLNNRFSCAVVGTREMTEYGKCTAYNIGWGLGDGGAVLVSGLALGIDGMAMAGAQSAGGATVGVLGCGIDIIYPGEHKTLFGRTLERGAIITEYPPGSPPLKGHFPVRNRIISGLCQATAIIEADESSGALITAKHALYQGRMLFSVPGNVGEANTVGTNKLLNEGASVLRDANDILEKFEFLYPHDLKPARKTPGRADDATFIASVARVVSTADPKSKYMGGGVYGGRKKKRTSSKKNNSLAEIYFAGLDDTVSEAKTEAEKKTSEMKHIHVDMLGDKEREIYSLMKPDTPMLAEEIGDGRYTISEVLTAMTLLEISGAVEAGAGGYYIRCSWDDDLIDGVTEHKTE